MSEASKPTKVLCWLGLHHWRRVFTDSSRRELIGRYCVRCGIGETL